MITLHASNEPQGQLGPQPWLRAAPTLTVIEALQANGAEVRFVGGCVRDALAKHPVKDIDLATQTEPDTVIKLLERAGIKAVPTGITHGTVTAVSGERSFQITTLRRDEKTDGRHAKIAFTDDWVADAERRDFTINAMSADPKGRVYDYNDGISDLAQGKVRFIGHAETRIDEDYLRILRFFRFHGGYGRLPLDREAMAACRLRAEKLTELSTERVRAELMKILMVPDPAEILIHMRGIGALDIVLPEAGDVARLRMLNWLETRAVNIEGVNTDALRHLAALLDPRRAENAAISAAARLKLSNAERTRLTDLMVPTLGVSAEMDTEQESRAMRRMGANQTRDLVLLAWAGELTASARLPRSRTDSYIAFLKRCATWTTPEFPLTGADLIALGIPEGPEIGDLLDRIENWWENGGYKADRQHCLNRLLWETKRTK